MYQQQARLKKLLTGIDALQRQANPQAAYVCIALRAGESDDDAIERHFAETGVRPSPDGLTVFIQHFGDRIPKILDSVSRAPTITEIEKRTA